MLSPAGALRAGADADAVRLHQEPGLQLLMLPLVPLCALFRHEILTVLVSDAFGSHTFNSRLAGAAALAAALDPWWSPWRCTIATAARSITTRTSGSATASGSASTVDRHLPLPLAGFVV